jgi:hypothetical protein
MQPFIAALRDLGLTVAAGALAARIPGGYEQSINALFVVAAVASALVKVTAAQDATAGIEEERS